MNVWPHTPQVSALVRAIVAKDLEAARLALASGAQVDCVHIGGNCSALAIAVRHRNQDMVELLLGAGANPAFPVPPLKNKPQDPSGLPLLYEFTNALAQACTGKQVRLLSSMLDVPACKLHAEVVKKIAFTWAMNPKIPNHIFRALREGASRQRVALPSAVDLLQATLSHRIKQRTQDVLDAYAVPDHARASSIHAIPPMGPDAGLIRKALETIESDTSAPALKVLLQHWHEVAPTKTGRWEVVHGVAMAAIGVGNAPVLALVLPDLLARLTADSRRGLVRCAIPAGHFKVLELLETLSPLEWAQGLQAKAHDDDEHPVSWWFKTAGVAQGSVADVRSLEKLVQACGLPPADRMLFHALAKKWGMDEAGKVKAVDVLVHAGADPTLCDADGKRPEQVIGNILNGPNPEQFKAKLISARLEGMWTTPDAKTSKPRF